MDDLVSWLRQQLDEDEREAEEALRRTTTTRRWIGGQWVEDTVQPPEWRRSVWDPERVLREIEVKRRMITDVAAASASALDMEHGCCHEPAQILAGMCERFAPDELPLLRLLALPYADRPGFREEWRP